MGAHGRRLLGWAVHLAFFAAWWQVALLMDRQMHEAPKGPIAPAPAAAETRLLPQGEALARQQRQAEAAPAAAAEPRARLSQLGMRAT